MKTIKLPAILNVIIILVTCAIINGCKSQTVNDFNRDVIPVKTAPVKKQRLSIPVFTSGRLFPKKMIKLSFKVGGIIGKLHADEGDTAKKGQLLASLNVSEIQSRFNQARESFHKAQRDLKRVQNLYKDRAATLEQEQNAQTAYDVALADFKVATFNLNHSYIRAPVNGKIFKRLSEESEMISPGVPVFFFGSTAEHWVIKVGVCEKDILRLNPGDKAHIKFDPYSGEEFSASVTEISQAIDFKSGTYEVELTLNQPPNGKNLKLIAGFVGKARIEPSEKKTYYVVPIDTIVEGEGDEGILFTVKDAKAVKVKIKIAHILPQVVAVRSGLENVDVVVTSGAAYLRDGSAVKIILTR